MTMTTMPESLNSPVTGKAVFMEFGPPNQQMSPSPMSHGHYSMHCLHSAGHSQPDGAYSSASSFSRPLGYPYVNSVSSHASSPYISSVQSYPGSASLAQSRLEDPGTCSCQGEGEEGQKEGGGREVIGWGWEGAGAAEVSGINLWFLVRANELKIKILPTWNYPAKDKSESVPWNSRGLWAAPCARWKTETHMCTY